MPENSFVSTDGILTLQFRTDGSFQRDGFVASYTGSWFFRSVKMTWLAQVLSGVKSQ